MTGITIGVGKYAEMAKRAAACMSEHTGIPVVVLGDDIFQRLRPQRPHQLKFELFRAVDDNELLYFDADLICVSPWSPLSYSGSSSLVAVRDVWFMSHISDDAKRLGISARRYFNSGLFIMNRQAHEPVLALAKKLMEHVPARPFRDQSHLNLACALLDVPISFLDRRYNWVGFRSGEISHCIRPINCHFTVNTKMSAGRPIALDVEGLAMKPLVGDDLFHSLAGLYAYERSGKDRRILMLSPDGTIGFNWAGKELYWFPLTDHDRTQIAICDRDEITCILEQNGERWEGRWLRFEKMPVTLSR